MLAVFAILRCCVREQMAARHHVGSDDVTLVDTEYGTSVAGPEKAVSIMRCTQRSMAALVPDGRVRATAGGWFMPVQLVEFSFVGFLKVLHGGRSISNVAKCTLAGEAHECHCQRFMSSSSSISAVTVAAPILHKDCRFVCVEHPALRLRPHGAHPVASPRRPGRHLGFCTLADIALHNLIHGCPVSRDAFLQPRKQQPCVVTQLRRTSRLRRAPQPARSACVRRSTRAGCVARRGRDVRHSLRVCCIECMLICVTCVAGATSAMPLMRPPGLPVRASCAQKQSPPLICAKQIAWLGTLIDQRVQRVRHDRGGECASAA